MPDNLPKFIAGPMVSLQPTKFVGDTERARKIDNTNTETRVHSHTVNSYEDSDFVNHLN